MSDLVIPVDDDGCVANMEGLGSTVEYNQYRQFSLLMGVLTIIIGSLGLVGNVIRYLMPPPSHGFLGKLDHPLNLLT